MRSLVTLAIVLTAGVSVVASVGCRRNRHPQQAQANQGLAYGLSDSDPDKRKEAAENLRDDGGPPPAAVPQLLTAIRNEPDKEAFAEMMITLGASGAPEAKAIIDAHIAHPDDELREAAEKALKLWAKKTGIEPMPKEVAQLQSPDWEVRRSAADDLGDDGGPPPVAIPALLAAAQRESHPKALGAMLITLGSSGVPEAKPLIDAHVNASDDDLRRYARKGLKNWMQKNGERVRQDITPIPVPPPPVASASTTTAPPPPPPPNPAKAAADGCKQFATICANDPFDVNRCTRDLSQRSYEQIQAWAECVNASTDPCQKAHNECVARK